MTSIADDPDRLRALRDFLAARSSDQAYQVGLAQLPDGVKAFNERRLWTAMVADGLAENASVAEALLEELARTGELTVRVDVFERSDEIRGSVDDPPPTERKAYFMSG